MTGMVIEPSAVIRQSSRLLMEMYVGLLEAGFAQEEAIPIVAAMAMTMVQED